MKTNQNNKRGATASIAALSVALLVGYASAKDYSNYDKKEYAKSYDEYTDRYQTRAEWLSLAGDGENTPAYHLEKFKIPLEFIAQYHPLPGKQYYGPTVLEKAAMARSAVEEVGKVVSYMRESVVAGDRPNEYVVEKADKALATLSDGYNEILAPATKQLDRIENDLKVVAGIMFVIAPGNQAGVQDATEQEDAELESAVLDFADQTASESEKAAAEVEDALQRNREATARVFHPFTAVEAQVLEQQALSELGLMRVAVARLRDAQSASREMQGKLASVSAYLQQADEYKSELAKNDGSYRKGMKGQQSAAQSSARTIDVAIDAVADFSALATELSGKMSNMMEGEFGRAVEAVVRCSEENLRMARFLQTDADFQPKRDLISSALEKNLNAVRSIEYASPSLHYVIEMKGGDLVTMGSLAKRYYQNIAAPKAGQSKSAQGADKAIKSTISGGTQLVCDAAGGC